MMSVTHLGSAGRGELQFHGLTGAASAICQGAHVPPATAAIVPQEQVKEALASGRQ